MHRDALDRLARALLEHETLDEQEILRVTQLQPAPKPHQPTLANVREAAFARRDALKDATQA